MIMIMTKKYNSPMLQVVSIKKSDIVTASETLSIGNNYNGSSSIEAAGRRNVFEEWYEGY